MKKFDRFIKRLVEFFRGLLNSKVEKDDNSGGSSPPVPDPENPVPKPDAGGAVYTVEPGKQIDRSLPVPCSLSFEITMGRDGSPQTEDVCCWAVSAGGDWRGGNPLPGTFGVRVNAYNADTWKMKVYGKGGFAGEKKLPMSWRAGQTYDVTLQVMTEAVKLTVNGQSIEIPCRTDTLVTLAYGWPSGRQGCLGAKLENAVWSNTGASISPDDISPIGIVWDEPAGDVGAWLCSANLGPAYWTGDGVQVDSITGTERWPLRGGDGGPKKVTIGNWWLGYLSYIDGKIHFFTVEWYGRGRLAFGGKRWDGTDDFHGVAGNAFRPKRGMVVYVMVSGCARAGAETVKERSQIRRVFIP